MQYFDPEPTAPSARRRVDLALPDLHLPLVTDRAVFSADKVDAGTRYLLLDAPHPPPGGHLLDLGCGYGPIAVALATRSPAATVWAVDVNERALALCAENATRLGLDNIRAVKPEDVDEDLRFSGIWSNPPIRVGKTELHRLLSTWLARLATGGHAYLVVQKHLGSDSLQRWLTDQGWATDRLGSRAGYRILVVTPGEAPT
jgi:16S rRNA (guanine1207-N2)-methyltransferase